MYCDHLTLTLAIIEHVVPNVRFSQCLLVTDDQQEELGPSDGDVETTLVKQEAERFFDVVLNVASDAAEDDDVFFTALEGVDGVDLHGLCQVTALVCA